MATFFTADTHFGHGGALGLYRRPFDSVAAMDAAMVAGWNAVVGPADEVWHLGDFALGRSDAAMAALLDGLAGTRRLVCGNNDGAGTRALAGWASVHDYVETTLDGTALVLCHYAFRSWNGMGRGAVNLHGHSHGRLSRQARQFDVGVDAQAFRPVTLERLRLRGPGRSGPSRRALPDA